MESAQKSQAPQPPGNSYTGICLTALVFIIVVMVVYFVCSNRHHVAAAPAGTGAGTGTGGTGWCKAGKPDGCNRSCDQNCCNDICAKRFPNGSGSCLGNPPYIPCAPCLCNYKC
uniref:Uncharacterized protein n=1 Tax=Kalanchoe fedtschenkoi TaxID=63787 RepID=A0A7N0RE24_KALFE